MSNDEAWPALPYEDWRETYQTLHLWSQVVGKVALALAPPLNHCWGVALHVTARGLATRMLPQGSRSFVLEFDFIDHVLAITCSDGQRGQVALKPRTVADFYHAVMGALRDLGLEVDIWPVAVELPEPVRLDEDTRHRTYEAVWAQRFWRILVQVDRVFSQWRCDYVGKSSPVNFFWGSFDMAVTRFSGRRAPPREGPAFEREAYSHEVISHGFWPGSGPVLEPAFYAYAVPQPAGLADAPVQPAEAYFHPQLSEFILPYDAVRTAASPDDALRAFLASTWRAAAGLGQWDIAVLERKPG
jgi:hypothetical protein